ncbi:MAG: GspH/FimT family pseudopilin [Magnetococcales bacterium]|nr:GspH/FimT family pseudopilin [Magnetococcales bacterium]
MDKVARHGFTLLELLITLAVVAVLLTIGIPYMRDAILTQRVRNAVSDYHLSLVYARSEAIKRNANVDLVPVVAGSWNNGWSVQSGATALKTMDAYPALDIDGSPGTITYQRNGRPAATVDPFNVFVSGNSGVTMRCVVVSANGMPHIRIDTDNDTANGCN